MANTKFSLLNYATMVDKNNSEELVVICNYGGDAAGIDINAGDILFAIVALNEEPIKWNAVREFPTD